MKDSSYQHVCTVLVGISTLFRYICYDMATFIVESLVHSAHLRDPNSIIKHAGYYGQAVKEISTCLATFTVPVVLNYLKPKTILLIGSGMFIFYFACFFYINNYLYFLANILLGIAFALIYTAFLTYQMQFSTRKTLPRNSARITAIGNLSLILGGCLYIYVSKSRPHEADSISAETDYRYYSEGETRMLCGFLLASCLGNFVLTGLFPSKEVEDSVSSENPQVKLALKEQLGAVGSALVNPYILILIPRFLSHGLFISFMMNVYPTSLQYSTILARNYPMMTAYYAFAMCAGSTLCGILIAPLNRAFHDFGMRPLYYITVVLQLAIYILAGGELGSARATKPVAKL
ncbi:hypothetical protein PFISCL1PPCAC_11779 [Pristionchus fissidentatus]|uniref:Membrane transporter n=1 Tax=Pristionchus fissidentatus TaxID=1538716 RepID=A0AAV5VL86_9BILA|nr:hypothetical protein PFISCL1PPCAC_11779 [Pristionchus fissidentatus]